MNLDEALAIRLMLKDIGYPNKDQTAALAEAERMIAYYANRAIAKFKADGGGGWMTGP